MIGEEINTWIVNPLHA